MPLHCIGERRNTSEDDADTTCSMWTDIPESLLLHIFSYLEANHLISVSQTCKIWCRVAYDESLWRALLWRTWDIYGVTLPPGRDSWYLEYRRLHYNCPVILTEVLKDHSDEVLHVSFSHGGDMFSTTSKDASIKVWQVGYPTILKYSRDFRELLAWDFTQFSCFNKSDTMLLVSSVKTTDFLDRRGFVAILSLVHNLQILRVVSMDPSQLFGAWLDDNTFLGGYLEISLDRFATTVQIESFQVDKNVPLPNDSPPVVEEGVGQNLFTFSSETASLIKFLTVANITNQTAMEAAASQPKESCKEKDIYTGNEESLDTENMCCNCNKNQNNHNLGAYNSEGKCICERTSWEGSRNAKRSESCVLSTNCTKLEGSGSLSTCTKVEDSNSTPAVEEDSSVKNLIFVTGEFAVALHQLGIKNVSTDTALKQTSSQNEKESEEMELGEESHHMVVNFSNNDIHVQPVRKSDKPDHLIDLFGHVTGLCLSSDNRYLFLNYRPWIGKVDRNDPWATPDLSPSIEVLVIDLLTLKNEGVRYVGHKGYSPSTMCCFVFLDVSQDYVGSGSEDARAYLWDKHYRNNIAVYEHSWGVVNAVGFNPANQEYMVTVSDDNTIKIWRSRSEVKKLGPLLDGNSTTQVEADKCVRKTWMCENAHASQET
ncbi:F-box/WD repeat-containing protein 5-like [Saccostrea echinata]|uniref:F-box/WD repeat-containing protein 5-like n=1 Tax=Saccostrea echinata TaxID=191078 RepID=UPI002A837A4F|nr:F-box/WD repeat-containing protein 5-like [Saccostrea echinata]